MLGGADQSIPVVPDVIRWATYLGHHLGGIFRWHQFNRMPGTDNQGMWIGLLLRQLNTNITAGATFGIDFTPGLHALDAVRVFNQPNAIINWTDLETRFTARTIIGVNDRQILGYFFSHSFDSLQGTLAALHGQVIIV